MPAGRYYRSLMKSILSIFAVVLFVPIIIIGSVIYGQFYSAFKQKAHAHCKTLAIGAAQQLDCYIRDKRDLLNAYLDTGRTFESQNTSRLQEALNAINHEYGTVFESLGLIGQNGRLLTHTASFPTGLLNRGNDGKPYSVCCIAANDWDVVLTNDGEGPQLVACIREDKREQAVVAIFALDKLSESVHKLLGGSRTGLYLLDRSASTIAQFDEDSKRDAQRKDSVLQAAYGQTEDAFVANGTGMDEGGYLYAGAAMKSTGGRLVYRIPAAEVYAGLSKVRLYSISVCLIVGLGIAAEVYRLTRKMVFRIEQTDREKELQKEQMLQTEKLAAIGELATGIAHEINNPVAIMAEEAGWIEDLVHDADDAGFQEAEDKAEVMRAAKQIQLQGRRCKEITQKLLSFARKSDHTVQEVDLESLITDIISITEKRAELRGIALESDIQEDMPRLNLSYTELQQVLLNLINNALDAMEDGGGTLSIDAHKEEGRIHIAISDTGPGIPSEQLSRVFDPFFTTKAVGKGTGLGLSICYGIIEKLGGEITAENLPETGSRFHIYVPLADSSDRQHGL